MLTERLKQLIRRKFRAMSPSNRRETARGKLKLTLEIRIRVVVSQATTIIMVTAATGRGAEGTTPREGLVPGPLKVIHP